MPHSFAPLTNNEHGFQYAFLAGRDRDAFAQAEARLNKQQDVESPAASVDAFQPWLRNLAFSANIAHHDDARHAPVLRANFASQAFSD